jgi:NAD(P)-dependent dehydrogenase (short-subunit alcohol dehydrogenase family)
MVPAGRIGRPDEGAQAALWLCSDAASYLTSAPLKSPLNQLDLFLFRQLPVTAPL